MLELPGGSVQCGIRVHVVESTGVGGEAIAMSINSGNREEAGASKIYGGKSVGRTE